MGSPVTVPGDLLPGLLRPRVPVLRVLRDEPLELAGGVNVFMFEYDDEPGVCLLADEQGIYPDTPIAELALVLSEPDGWDAAVDALARHYWPDMGETERAVFFHGEMRWFLLRPFPRQTVSWRMDYRAHQPHEALRCVLEQASWRPTTT